MMKGEHFANIKISCYVSFTADLTHLLYGKISVLRILFISYCWTWPFDY